jgi:hypothetical protein
MRRVILGLLLVFILAIAAIAAGKAREDVPPGMEIITIDKVNYLVPKGTKVFERNGTLVLESRSEYMVRRFDLLDQELKLIRTQEESLATEIKALKDKITELENSDQLLRAQISGLAQNR